MSLLKMVLQMTGIPKFDQSHAQLTRAALTLALEVHATSKRDFTQYIQIKLTQGLRCAQMPVHLDKCVLDLLRISD